MTDRGAPMGKKDLTELSEKMKQMKTDLQRNATDLKESLWIDVAECRENAEMTVEQTKEQGKRLKEERRKWVRDMIFFSLEDEGNHKTQVKRVIVAALVLLGCSSVSGILLHYGLFSENARSFLSMFFFSISPIPLSVLTAVFGLEMGILGFGINFISVLSIAGTQSYLLFYLLAYILMTDIAVRRDGYLGRKKAWKTLAIQHLLVAYLMYLLFIQLGGANFSPFRIMEISYRFVTMIPQTTLNFLVVRWTLKYIRKKYPEFVASRVAFRRAFLQNKTTPSGSELRCRLSQRIYYILVAEAIGLGISAAFFANLLVPSLREELQDAANYSTEVSVSVTDGGTGAAVTAADAEDPDNADAGETAAGDPDGADAGETAADAEGATSTDAAAEDTGRADAERSARMEELLTSQDLTFAERMALLAKEITAEGSEPSETYAAGDERGGAYWSDSLEQAQIGRAHV